MRRYAAIIVILLTLCVPRVVAAPVAISGVAPEYPNYQLAFFEYEDMVSYKELKLGECTTDSLGKFSLTIDVASTRQVFTYLGLYKAYLFAEPGRTYEIVLPPRVDKGLTEDLNPYFVEEDMSLGVKSVDTTELNYLVMDFNNMYEPFIAKYFNRLYLLSDIALVDSLQKESDKRYGNVKNEFFNDYVRYRFFYLRHFTYERDKNFATRKYFLNKPVLYQNPAYMEFFDQLWGKFFTGQVLNEKYGEVLQSNIIFSKSPHEMKRTLNQNPALRNDTLMELVMLNGLLDCYSRPDVYPRQTIDQTIDSMAMLSPIAEHKIIARNIRKVEEKLSAPDVAPEFTLPDVNNNNVPLSSFRGKFVYLVFGRSENYACLKDYKLVADLKKSNLQGLEIITVSCDQDRASFDDFVRSNPNYTWTFLYDEGKKVASLYSQKVLPAYVLVDPDGKIAMLPAVSPHENFKAHYSQIRIWRQRALDAKTRNR